MQVSLYDDMRDALCGKLGPQSYLEATLATYTATNSASTAYECFFDLQEKCIDDRITEYSVARPYCVEDKSTCPITDLVVVDSSKSDLFASSYTGYSSVQSSG